MNNEKEWNASPWLSYEAGDVSRLVTGLKPQCFSKGTVLYYEGEESDYVFLVKSGRVGICAESTGGRERLVFVAGKGMIVGELSSIDCLSNCCRATVISSRAEIYFIPKTTFNRAMQEDPALSRDVTMMMCRTIRTLIAQIRILTFSSAEARVCYGLLNLLEGYSSPAEEGMRIDVTFSHQDLADQTGLSRVSVSSMLSFLSKEHVIEKKNGYYYVYDVERLRQIARENEK